MIRPARGDELGALAKLWRDGWHDAHAAIVPEALTRLRTIENFTERMAPMLPTVRVIERDGAAIGFHFLKDDELNQFYLAATARGSGAANALMADAETHLAQAGLTRAWLSCAIGNDRAARFYEKAGWTRAGTMIDWPQTAEGPFRLETWRYEKALAL
ncbi:MAG: N-acetyltransferase family protein [Hyphomonadaceae bacterium]